MLLRSSISSTKKFFHKTIKNFKSFFSPGYERLPKTPPHNHFSYSSVKDMNNSNTKYHELEKFHTDFNEQWDSEEEKARRRNKKKVALSLSSPTPENEAYNNASPSQKRIQMEKREEYYDNQSRKRSMAHQRGRQEGSSSLKSMVMREKRNYFVEQKLRELEMLDMNNVEYVLDIEEVLHYYSRLTCPTYLEIVDKFFMEIYSEFFGPSLTWPRAPCSGNSRLRLRYQ